MTLTSNRSFLQKADLAIQDLTAGGAYLIPAQAKKFMRLLIKQSELLQMATFVPMGAPKHQISKIKFGSRILRPGKEATPLPVADRVKPDLSSMELDAQLFKAEVHLSDEVLEDNIEQATLQQTILDMIAEAAGRDMEDIVVNGDKNSAEPVLAVLDGILKQAQSHVVDAGGVAISKNFLRDMLRSLPGEYLRDKKQMVFLCSVDADLDYRNTLAERATAGGDRFLEEDTPVMYSGVPLRSIPLFPENLGPQNNRTALLLCNPKNIHIGLWRKIKIESIRDPSAGVLKIVATLRFDARFAEEPGVAKLINVQL
jgi:hypothetical protein